MDEIKKSWHNCPTQDTGEYQYIINPLTDQIPACDPVLLEKSCEYLEKMSDFSEADIILGEEDRGGILIPFVARSTETLFSIAKWYPSGLEGEHKADFENGYAEGSLYINGVSKGDKVVIVDDLISTGGTLINLIEAVRSIGAEVLDVVTICEKHKYGGAEKVEEETGLRPKTGFQVEIRNGKAKVLEFD